MPEASERDARLVARYRRLLLALALIFVAAELLAAAGVAPEPLRAVWGAYGFGQFFSMALLGTFALHLWCRPRRGEARATIGLAVALELLRVTVQHALGWEPRWIALSTGFGAGLASIVVLAVVSRRDVERRVLFHAAIIVPFAVLLSNSLVQLTTALHPLTLDGRVYAFDASLGFQPSFLVGRLFARLPLLARVAEIVYLATPFGFALIWATQRRADTPAPIDVMTAFLVATGAGFALYHAFPVAGPIYVAGAGWPTHAPPVATLGLVPLRVQPVARNCMPSLHTTWVLLLLWHARGRGRVVQAIALGFLIFTLLATLGDGLHYLADLVVALPFALAAQAASAPPSPARRRIFAIAAALLSGWLIALRACLLVRAPSLPLSWLLVVATVGGSLWLERRLYAASLGVAVPPSPSPSPSLSHRTWPRSWPWLAAGAGVALAWVSAPATVSLNLPSLLLAFALGALVAAQLAGRAPVGTAAASAGLLALACAIAPWSAAGPHAAALAVGGLVAALGARAPLPLLLMAALVAAALGTLAADAIVPVLGGARVAWLAAAVALAVAAVLVRERAADALEPDAAVAAEPPNAGRATAAAAACAFAGFAFVAATRPLLAFVVGDTIYAGAAACTALLAGAGLGCLAAAAARAAAVRARTIVACALVALVAAALADTLAWSALAHYFASFAAYPLTRGFAAREVVRLAAALVVLAPPAAAAAAALAALVDAAPPRRAARDLAAAAAAGALATVFVATLAPALGGVVQRAQIAGGSHVAFEPAACEGAAGVAVTSAAIATIDDNGRLCDDGRPAFTAIAPVAPLAAGGHALVVGAPPPAGFASVDLIAPDEAEARLLALVHPEWHPRAADVIATLNGAPAAYDRIAIVRPTPASPADARLFSRELFAAAARASSPRGLLALAVPLARVSPRSLAAIAVAARSAFAHAALLLPRDELAPATLLACAAACPAADLDGDALDAFAAAVAARGKLLPEELAADGDAEALAWSLPRAAGWPASASWRRNVELLSAFAKK